MRDCMDDTYIAALLPALTQAQFTASIARINVAYAADPWMQPVGLALLTAIPAGFICFVVGANLTVQQFGFHPLVAVGLALFLGGAVLTAVLSCYVTGVQRGRLMAAIVIENANYSQKVPPVSFRLQEVMRSGRGRAIEFTIAIDVGAQLMLPGAVNVAQTNNWYQASPMQPQYGMGAVPMLQPSSQPRFYGGLGSNAVAPAPPGMMQQQYGQQLYGMQQPDYGGPLLQQQYYPQQTYGQQRPMYYNHLDLRQQPPPYTAQQPEQPYPPQPQQPIEAPLKPTQQDEEIVQA